CISVNVGLGTSRVLSAARWRIMARANVVLPAPSTPESVIMSPGASALATSTISRRVACSSGSTAEKLASAGVVGRSVIAAPHLPRACGGRLARDGLESERFAKYLLCHPGRAQREPGSNSQRMHMWCVGSRIALRASGMTGSFAEFSPLTSCRRPLARFAEREDAGDGGAAADRGVERHSAAVQLDKGAHQRQAKPGAAVARAERMSLEPIEHLVLHIGRNARAVVG